ncbi:MAG: hypothetical protein H7831_09910 [Magnetococcus sp. WYHC-3]
MTLQEKINKVEQILDNPPEGMGLMQHAKLLLEDYPNLLLAKKLNLQKNMGNELNQTTPDEPFAIPSDPEDLDREEPTDEELENGLENEMDEELDEELKEE